MSTLTRVPWVGTLGFVQTNTALRQAVLRRRLRRPTGNGWRERVPLPLLVAAFDHDHPYAYAEVVGQITTLSLEGKRITAAGTINLDEVDQLWRKTANLLRNGATVPIGLRLTERSVDYGGPAMRLDRRRGLLVVDRWSIKDAMLHKATAWHGVGIRLTVNASERVDVPHSGRGVTATRR